MKQLLIVAYEYHGYHSVQGAALSRRVKQVADSFTNNNWNVTIIHKDAREEVEAGKQFFIDGNTQNNIIRIVVKDAQPGYRIENLAFFRRLFTLFYITFYGDRSVHWANNVVNHLEKFNAPSPDLIMSFYTPRGPITLANILKKKFKVPWIADLQDELEEGMRSKINIFLSHKWSKRRLKHANAVTHVSTEWAVKDGKAIGKKIETIRHALSYDVYNTSWHNNKTNADEFIIFYGGMLGEYQSLSVLSAVLDKVCRRSDRKIRLVFAGTETVLTYIRNNIKADIEIDYKGWVSPEEYKELIIQADCCLIIPWSSQPRMVIPSKFYEAAQYRKPIWIIGNDTGAFAYLFKDWQHPVIDISNVDFQVQALEKAIGGDYASMFNIDSCKGSVFFDKDFFSTLIRLV